MCATVHMWRTEYIRVGPLFPPLWNLGIELRSPGWCGKGLYQLSHLTGPLAYVLGVGGPLICVAFIGY